MKTLLVGFGDSWTIGAELPDPPNQNWVVQVAKRMGAEYINLGTSGTGVEHLTVQLFNFLKTKEQYADYKIIFMVGMSGASRYLSYCNQRKEFISITPNACYRTTGIDPGGRPPEVANDFVNVSYNVYTMVDCAEYNNFIAAKTVFAIQNYCKNNNIDCIFFSFWEAPDFLGYPVDTKYVCPTPMTELLTGMSMSPELLEHEYFAGNMFHPNLAGQTQMSELIYDYYISAYPGN